MKRLSAIPAALILAIILSATALASDYETIRFQGSVITDQVNQVRSPNLDKKYFLYKVADTRAQIQADERDASGTSEFEHDLAPVTEALQDLGVCYNWVGEVIGYSSTLRDSPPAATADDIVDRWEASEPHNDLIKDPTGDWGGGGWVLSDSGTYFFVFYVVDVCGE